MLEFWLVTLHWEFKKTWYKRVGYPPGPYVWSRGQCNGHRYVRRKHVCLLVCVDVWCVKNRLIDLRHFASLPSWRGGGFLQLGRSEYQWNFMYSVGSQRLTGISLFWRIFFVFHVIKGFREYAINSSVNAAPVFP